MFMSKTSGTLPKHVKRAANGGGKSKLHMPLHNPQPITVGKVQSVLPTKRK